MKSLNNLIFAGRFLKYILIKNTFILWKPDKPIFMTHALWKDLILLVHIKLLQLIWLWFLDQLGWWSFL